ncbi:MAG TPA: chromate transporter [Acetivibrio sp.]|nr:chromate transporter [Acetivibrio sp.]HPT91337.1 chromate transporter [Acetivibrio sp.]HQA56861.1 chromate transporter [Acetivibrio sp.]
MIYWLLFWTFFKIGAVSFGGGYAMIPLMQEELEALGWMDAEEFANILAVSEMTPGPLATNTATYVGAKTAGVLGSMAATLGVALPSLVIITLVARFFIQFKESKLVNSILQVIRPVTIGLISSAVIFISQTSILKSKIEFPGLFELLKGNVSSLISSIQPDFAGITIFVIILVAIAKYKLHPILAIMLSALLGIASYIIFGV